MNRTANSRRAATRRVNDENAVPRASNAIRPAKQATRSGITQKESSIKEVIGKNDKRVRNALGAISHNEAPAAVQNGKVSQVQRQPLASRSQAQNVYPSNAETRPIAPVPARTRPGRATAVEEQADFMVGMEVDQGVVLDEALETDEDTVRGMSDDEYDMEEEDWTLLSPNEASIAEAQLFRIRRDFQDDVDEYDTTMVAEYADEIFAHMELMEGTVMPNPNYMEFQTETDWTMRTTLIDWLLQVHMRYHMLPETLWIAVNIIDRFLSVRVVSLSKLQLVGVTAMFIAAKYEEILAPSVDDFVFMTENGYTKDDILKGERIVLQTLDFNVSQYCSPYSWVRRISKADDYDIQTRTLSKFLMEVTLLDHRFLRCKPSMIAAIGMYLSRKMLGGTWDEAFIFYSNFTERQLVPGAVLLCERLVEDGFDKVYVYKKYANKKFLRASTFAVEWAHNHAETTWASQE
ncbi:A/B/D/E cyclin [Cutaneotrichosporon oleaginosum]|uniref:A/B/D/E cyclin n=1 Tax=Cutaneotrichosporon oleaginosum TaxID=879819 RepID=A0A0J0XDW7_9TREE|nr:A/B/D/E cyclin [Cutaneotrichosporon oleaginosum]KLT39281.1 A/B/D/E cyclin [Cutaneotrichosporon oleaginosum]